MNAIEEMASSPESDDDVTPKPLRVKSQHNSDLLHSRIPQRSSSIYFSHPTNSIRQLPGDSDSMLSSLIPSPADSPSLTVSKSRRSDTSSTESHDNGISARQRQCPISSPPHVSKFPSSLENLSGSSSSSTEYSRGGGSKYVEDRLRANPLIVDNVDGLEHDNPESDDKVNRGSQMRLYKQKFLQKIGTGFRARPATDNEITDRSKLITQDLALCHGYPERNVNLLPTLPGDSSGTTESTKAACFDYPSPLSTATRSSLTTWTAATSSNSTPSTPSLTKARRSTCPVLAAKLVLTPELDRVAMDCENSMFVAVDVEAVVEQCCLTSLGAAKSVLEIAVVVDNSILTSPASLMASCEAISFIASKLCHSQDRLAILTTHGCGTEPGPRIVLSMESANAERVRAATDSITLFSTKTHTKIAETINAAARLEGKDSPKEVDVDHQDTSLRHVVVFTTDSDAVGPGLYQVDESTTLHFVNPSLVPWKTFAASSIHGWIIMNDLSPSLSTAEFDHFELHRKLEMMLADMRHHHDHGRLTNIVLKIKAGYKCRLQGIMGETTFLRFFPGEKRTCLVKVQTNLLPDQRSRLLAFPSGLRTASGAIDIEKELEHIIGNECRTILSVTVRYEHSLFPEGTICSCQSDARISEYVQIPEGCGQYASSEVTLTAAASVRKSVVQRRIIAHLATYQSVGQALTTLASHFGPNSNHSSCPAYLESMVKELKHRLRIQERYDSNCERGVMANVHDNKIHSENRQSMLSGNMIKPLCSAFSDPTCASTHTPSAQPTANISMTKDKKDTDMARQIWLELRRNSRSAHHTQTSMSPRSERNIKGGRFSADEWRRIQSIAVKNKRSLGQDTLRSLSYAGTRTQNSAPWL